MAVEIILTTAHDEQRLRVPYNGKDLFAVINTTLNYERENALSWAAFGLDCTKKMSIENIRSLQDRLMRALVDLSFHDQWFYPSGSPLTTVEKMETQIQHVKILEMLTTAQRDKKQNSLKVLA